MMRKPLPERARLLCAGQASECGASGRWEELSQGNSTGNDRRFHKDVIETLSQGNGLRGSRRRQDGGLKARSRQSANGHRNAELFKCIQIFRRSSCNRRSTRRDRGSRPRTARRRGGRVRERAAARQCKSRSDDAHACANRCAERPACNRRL
jgi:hypothetical protein